MKLKHQALAFALPICLTLSGCAPFPPHTTYTAAAGPVQAYDYDEGWRVAELRQIGPARSIPHTHQWDCRTATNVSAPEQPYALVRFKRAKLPIERVVPVMQADSLKPGQQVIVNIHTCAQPVLFANSH